MEPNNYQKYGKKWYEKNKDKELQRSAKYYLDNLDKGKQKYSRRRDAILKERYGISEYEYQFIVDTQNGLCKICGKPPVEGRRLDVDHCHTTGKVRGLLCNNCNRGIGHLQESVEILSNALKYLK